MACISDNNLNDTLQDNLGRRCTIYSDGGDAFTGVLSDVSDTTCTLISAGNNNRCGGAQRINTIPIDKISCLATSRM